MRYAAVLALALALAGCSQASTSAGPSASVSTPAELPAECPAIDLRSPSGNRVDLTGTWRGNNDAYWQFLQVGDCVWASGTDFYFAHSLRGELRPDFTVLVEYVHLAGTSPTTTLPFGYGHATLRVEFTVSNGVETLTLNKVAGCSSSGEDCAAGEVPLQTTVWTRVSDTPRFPLPTPGH